MNQIILSDEALKQAAASVQRAMLDSLPSPAECEHEFSPAFQARMKKLITQFNLRRTVRKTMQRAAMFALAALIGVSAWLSVDAQARESFFSRVREVYEEHIVYRFFGEPAAKTLPAYRITWLPEGYGEPLTHDSEQRYAALYQIDNDTDSQFVFEYTFMRNDMYIHVDFDDAGCVHETVNLNGMQADFYQAVNPGDANKLFWFDEDTELVFILSGSLEKSVMLHIAQSVILTNSTN